MRGVPGSFGGRACIALGFSSSSSFVPPAPFISLARVRVPVKLSGDDGNGGVVSGEICMRLVLVFLLALGKDLMCSPVSFTYRAGGVVAGCGLPGGLLLRSGGGGAILVSGSLVCHLLESAHLSSPSIRLPILFQRFKSVLMGDLGRWFLLLNHAMESDDGGFGGFSFDSAPAGDGSRLLVLTVAPKRMRMTNRSFRDSFVISFSFGGLVVKGGMYCFLV